MTGPEWRPPPHRCELPHWLEMSLRLRPDSRLARLRRRLGWLAFLAARWLLREYEDL